MYIEEIRLRNYKNFISEKAVFKPGVNVILGENDSGKSNFMSAIRLVLDKKLPWYEKEIKEEMFSASLPNWKGHVIIISIFFSGLNKNNEYECVFSYDTGISLTKGSISLFILPNKNKRDILHNCKNKNEFDEEINKLSVSDYEMIYTVGVNRDFTIDNEYYNLVGNLENGEYKMSSSLDEAIIGNCINNMENIRNTLLSFTYIDALRDTVREMNQKNNPLMNLIRQIEQNVLDDEKANVKNKISDLNSSIANVKEIKKLTKRINHKINESVGVIYSPNLNLISDMSSEMKNIFRNLKLKSNIGFDLELNEMGLGSNNIVYIALKLLENMNITESKYFLLLFEEPEAHLHKHLQMALFEKTGIYAKNNVQIIMSTHSDNISASSRIGSMNIIQKNNNTSIICNPSQGLNEEEIDVLERYLDVKRSELLFSRSVILVEGDAEEILMPVIIKKVFGLSLDELGVSIINIGSVGFDNIYRIFNEKRIKKRCAIVSDLDTPLDDNNVSQQNAYSRGIKRFETIKNENLINEYIKGFFGKYTFEVELIPNNISYFEKLVDSTYVDPNTIIKYKTHLNNHNVQVYGKCSLDIAEHNKKGWNALKLTEYVDGKFYIPKYLVDALLFVAADTLKNVENLKIILKNYCEIYCDENLLSKIKDTEDNIDDKNDIKNLIEFAENQNAQIIKIVKRILQ